MTSLGRVELASPSVGRSWKSGRWQGRVGRRAVERPVRPVAVVAVDEDAEYALEVAPVENEEPVETLGAGGADEALGDRIRFR